MIRKPQWDYWRQMPQVLVWEAVALSCDLEPKEHDSRAASLREPFFELRHDRSAREVLELFRSRCEIAATNIAAGFLDAEPKNRAELYRTVSLSVFVDWATSRKWPMPSALADAVADAPVREEFAFDPDSEFYPQELDIALTVWRAVSRSPKVGKSPKRQIKDWLELNWPGLTAEARERISTVGNWKPAGGKPKT